MPKGALLHAHLDATVDPETLLGLALKHPAMHIRVPEFITAENIRTICPTFKALPHADYANGLGVTDQAYTPNTFVTIQKARDTFDSSLGGPKGFDNWICSAMTINPAEAYGTHNTIAKVSLILQFLCANIDDMHGRFGKSSPAPLWYQVYAASTLSRFKHRPFAQGMIHCVPVYAEYIREFFKSSIEDGISYVEPRINFMNR